MHPFGGMNRVVEHRQHAPVAALVVKRSQHAGVDVGSAFRADTVRIAHGTGNHQGLREFPQQVQEKGTFLERIGSLCDNHALGTGFDLFFCPLQGMQEIFNFQAAAGHGKKGLCTQFGQGVQHRDGTDQILGAKCWLDPATFPSGTHADRTAECADSNNWFSHGILLKRVGIRQLVYHGRSE